MKASLAKLIKIGSSLAIISFIFINISHAKINTALSVDDINLIMDQGMKKILGGNAVSPLEKLSTTWSAIKKNR